MQSYNKFSGRSYQERNNNDGDWELAIAGERHTLPVLNSPLYQNGRRINALPRLAEKQLWQAIAAQGCPGTPPIAFHARILSKAPSTSGCRLVLTPVNSALPQTLCCARKRRAEFRPLCRPGRLW